MITVRVCCPVYRNPDPSTYRSIRNLNFIKNFKFYEYILSNSTLIQARNKLITDSFLTIQRTFPYDYYLLTDGDISFTNDHFLELYDTLNDNKNIMIVSALYEKNTDPFKYEAFYWSKNHKGLIETNLEKYKRYDKILKVDGFGLGFVLIRKKLWSKIKYPWFHNRIIRYKHYSKLCGEDNTFCLDLDDAGIDRYVNTNVIVNHKIDLK